MPQKNAAESNEEDGPNSKTSQRGKRKYDGKGESESRSVIVEMRMLFENLAAQQENKMDSLQKKFGFLEELPNELSSIRTDISEGRKEMADFILACGARIDQLETRILEVERKLENINIDSSNVVESVVAELRQQLNERDQDLLLNDLEISGVPEALDDRPMHIVKLLSITLGVEMDERDIIHAEQLGSSRRDRMVGSQPARPRNIILRVARRATRDQLLRAARVRRSLTTANLDVSIEPPCRVYVNERLTRTNRQLFGRVRDQARKLGWKFVWTREGKIFTRKRRRQASGTI